MPSKVYFLQLNQIEKVKDLLPKFQEPLGIKVHFGEAGNITYLPPRYVKQITDMLSDPIFVEASVLYKSPRSTAAGHKEVAREHGFDFLPIDITDGEVGDDNMEVEIEGKHFSKCYLGKGLEKYKSLLVISHFKGHMAAGFGGALKNIGMGLGSRRGKLAMHSSYITAGPGGALKDLGAGLVSRYGKSAIHSFNKHRVKKEKCISCGTCIANCPVNAITFDVDKKAFIDPDICISCSKCIAVCPVGAVQIPWGAAGKTGLQERIAEYAYAAQLGKQCFYINFLVNITDNCDCMGAEMQKITDDIGILVSDNPVAIDQASYDLVIAKHEEFKNHAADDQLRHGEELGLGNREYELIKS